MQFKRMTKSTREVLCAFGVSLAPSAERRIQDGPACIYPGARADRGARGRAAPIHARLALQTAILI